MPVNGAHFEHACFISYKHPPRTAPDNHFYKQFVEALKERLEYYLTTGIRTFLDTDADPGTSYPEALSRSLCKSVCLVAVLTPEYPDSSWCQAEWDAMKNLESKRLGPGRTGLIIPVVLRGDVRQWESRYKRTAVDMRVNVPTQQLKSIRTSEKVKRIAEQISVFVQQVREPGADCDGFRLAVAEDELASPASFRDPDPLSG
jgi:TIR domain